jgi:UDP-N-acetylglucosamine 1-carboxyvinyltransferase
MGADIAVEGGYIKARAPQGLQGGHYVFPRASHTATENLMMAATLAKGETVLANCAREPEIVDLADLLTAMGANIEGAGTNRIRIQGVDRLHGASHRVMPDRIETGTWLCAVGLCGGALTLNNTNLDHLGALMGPLEAAGLEIATNHGGTISVKRNGARLQGIDLMTEGYPGFPTDLQAQMMAMLSLADGASMITETIFENRFMHVPELNRMGANITVQGNSAIIRGVDKLVGTGVMATDLRASVALVLAGMAAEGETIIDRIYHLDRGYEGIVDKLAKCNIDVERI